MLYRKITSYLEEHLKSGTDKILILEKDYTVHSALNNLLGNPDYHIPAATVISNEREIYQDDKVTYMPVYLVMFMESDAPAENESEYIF